MISIEDSHYEIEELVDDNERNSNNSDIDPLIQ